MVDTSGEEISATSMKATNTRGASKISYEEKNYAQKQFWCHILQILRNKKI